MGQIGTIRVDTQNNGTVSVPVFDTGDSGSSIYEFVRVETANGTGFIPVEETGSATYPYLRVQSQNNGIVAVTDRSSAIPDLSSISKVKSSSFGSKSEGVAVSKNGEHIYVASEGTNEIDAGFMSTPYDVSTISQVATRTQSNEEGAHIELEGNSFLFGNDNNGTITQVLLNQPFDLNSENGVRTFDASPDIGTSQQAVSMAYDGSKMYCIGRNDATLAQYSLNILYDISSASLDQVFNINSLYGFNNDNLAGIDFGVNGNHCIITEGSGSNQTYQFILSTQNDFSTATEINRISTPDGDNQRGIAVTREYLYFADFDTGDVHQYEFQSRI